MTKAKMLQALALWAISALAVAGAIYLECACDPELHVRFASYADCLEASMHHNKQHHGGQPVARCRRDLR